MTCKTYTDLQAERADPELVRRDRLNCCHLSSVDLQQPVVSDYLGNLYTKAILLEFLLARDHGQLADVEAEHRHQNIMRTHPDGLKHIRSLKDVVEVCLDTSTAAASSAMAIPRINTSSCRTPANAGQMAHLLCPISQLPFLKNRVALLVTCGHVFCHSVIDMLQPQDGSNVPCQCPSCDQAFQMPTEVIEIAADGKHWKDQKERVDRRKAKRNKRKTHGADRTVTNHRRKDDVKSERPCKVMKS
eukprot:jgi/Ulvmu1/9036/UM005_0128.1